MITDDMHLATQDTEYVLITDLLATFVKLIGSPDISMRRTML